MLVRQAKAREISIYRLRDSERVPRELAKPTLLAEILKYEGTRTLVGTTISPKPEAPESDEDKDIDGELKGPERPPVQRRPIRAARKPA